MLGCCCIVNVNFQHLTSYMLDSCSHHQLFYPFHPIMVIKSDVMCPFCVRHHVDICVKVLVAFVKTYAKKFFLTPRLDPFIWWPKTYQVTTKIGNQICFWLSILWHPKKLLVTNFVAIKKRFCCHKKKRFGRQSYVNRKRFWSPSNDYAFSQMLTKTHYWSPFVKQLKVFSHQQFIN